MYDKEEDSLVQWVDKEGIPWSIMMAQTVLTGRNVEFK